MTLFTSLHEFGCNSFPQIHTKQPCDVFLRDLDPKAASCLAEGHHAVYRMTRSGR